MSFKLRLMKCQNQLQFSLIKNCSPKILQFKRTSKDIKIKKRTLTIMRIRFNRILRNIKKR